MLLWLRIGAIKVCLLDMVMNLMSSIKCRELLNKLRNDQLFRKDSTYWS
jgi:hypothetical protein